MRCRHTVLLAGEFACETAELDRGPKGAEQHPSQPVVVPLANEGQAAAAISRNEPRLPLMADGQEHYLIARLAIAVEGDVAGLPARDHQSAQLSDHAAADLRMVGQRQTAPWISPTAPGAARWSLSRSSSASGCRLLPALHRLWPPRVLTRSAGAHVLVDRFRGNSHRGALISREAAPRPAMNSRRLPARSGASSITEIR